MVTRRKSSLSEWGLNTSVIMIMGFILFASTPGTTVAQTKTFNLKYAGGLAQGTPLEIIPEWWGKEIEKRTDGKVKVALYFNQALGKQFDYPKMLKAGVCDIALLTTAGPEFPMLGVSMAPFVIPNTAKNMEAIWTIYYNGLLKELDDYKPLWYEPTDNFYYFFKNKKVSKLEDLKGLKLRGLPGFGAALNDTLGATGIAMPAQDVYTALERGTLDGLSTTAAFAQLMKLHEVMKYCLWEPLFSSGNVVGMTRQLWNSFPSDIQFAMEQLNAEARFRFMDSTKTPREDMEAVKKVGWDVYQLDRNEKDRWKKTSQQLIDKWVAENEAKGLPARRVIEVIKRVVDSYE